MKNDFDHLLELPGAPEEREWIRERLETLSVRESYALAAAATRNPPEDTSETADCLHTLDDYEICFPAGGYEELGALYLHQGSHIPKDVRPYVDLERLGQVYEEEHPGLFVGQCYVKYPARPAAPKCQENKLPLLWDGDWSVKLKLASPAVPEGVWLRLPCFDGEMPRDSLEVVLALHELKAESLEDCALLEARCILPEMSDLMKQYDSVTKLVSNGDYLGYVMDERSQDEEHWMEKFTAALEYEDCHTLHFALDIAQNLGCYEWVPEDDLEVSAEGLLLDAKVPQSVIDSGAIDLAGYKAHLLESAGYMRTGDGSGYIIRKDREFIRDFSTAEEGAPAQEGQGGMTMQ